MIYVLLPSCSAQVLHHTPYHILIFNAEYVSPPYRVQRATSVMVTKHEQVPGRSFGSQSIVICRQQIAREGGQVEPDKCAQCSAWAICHGAKQCAFQCPLRGVFVDLEGSCPMMGFYGVDEPCGDLPSYSVSDESVGGGRVRKVTMHAFVSDECNLSSKS